MTETMTTAYVCTAQELVRAERLPCTTFEPLTSCVVSS